MTGDLNGVLETLFREVPDGTRITFNWYVRVTNPALNFLGYFAEGMYRHSHDSVMNSGEKGLSKYCDRVRSGRDHSPSREERSLPDYPPSSSEPENVSGRPDPPPNENIPGNH